MISLSRSTPHSSPVRLSIFWVTLLALLLGTSSCVRTTIRSGQAPGATASNWQDRWHHGFVFGLDELHGPVFLEWICPAGWAEVETAIDPMQAVIALVTLGIYTPTTVSVVCADTRFSETPE